MFHTLKTWVAAGTMAVGTLASAVPASADHEEPYLTRIALYEEVGHGRHVAVAGRQIHLNVHDYGRDHFDFEVKGFDQYNRIMPDFAFSPELIFPAGQAYGSLEHLSGQHWRFHTGQFPVADVHVIVRDRFNRNIRETLHLSIAAPPPPAGYYEESPVVVYRTYEPPPRPIGYAIPTPHAPNPCHTVRRHHYGHHPYYGHRHQESSFGIRFGDEDSSFGIIIRTRD